MQVNETPILEVTFVTLTENSSVITNDPQGPWKHPHHQNKLLGHMSMHSMALKLPQYFYLLMEKPLGCYFQVRFLYNQVTQCDQKTPIPASSRWHVRSKKASTLISATTSAHLPEPVSTDLIITSDSVSTNPTWKDRLRGWSM